MIPIWLFDMLDMKIQMIWFIPNGWSHGNMLEFDPKIAVWYVCRTSFFVPHSILRMILECKFTMLGKDSKGFIGISWGLQWKCGSTWSFWLNRNNWVAQIQPKWGADKKPFKFDTWNQFMQQRKNMGVSGNWIYPKKCYLIRNMMF